MYRLQKGLELEKIQKFNLLTFTLAGYPSSCKKIAQFMSSTRFEKKSTLHWSYHIGFGRTYLRCDMYY